MPWTLPAARPAHTGDDAPVLLSSDPEHPSVTARLAAGERLISAPGHQPGERLVDAVAMMDKLRTAGPWESEQTHDSLRRFLLEETYELFDAVRSGDADALREELGDVLLQVLFTRASPRMRHSIRSPSTMSPTRCCENWATGLREFLPESRFRLTSSWLSGRNAKLWRSRGTRWWTTCPPVSRLWRWRIKWFSASPAPGSRWI